MRSITVSTDVFARIWSLRMPGEETEDAILRRVLAREGEPLPQPTSADAPHPPGSQATVGFIDRRYGVQFPDGFEILRNYLGTDYRARATGGHWLLQNDGQMYGSLNELSQAIGSKTENAWVNWFFNAPDGERRPVSDLRDPAKIGRRKMAARHLVDAGAPAESAGTAAGGGDEVTSLDVTWRDDVRDALRRLGGTARLRRIYDEVERARRAANRSIPPSLEAVVRRTLEDHSSDSDAYRGIADLFRMAEGRGAGIWALRV
jgi:hypothetical protein